MSKNFIIYFSSMIALFSALYCLYFPSSFLFLFILSNILLIIFISRIPINEIMSVFIVSALFSLPVGITNFFFSNSEKMMASDQGFSHLLIFLIAPLFLISFVSIISAKAIQFEELIISLMKKKWIQPRIGYVLIIAWQSIPEIKREWDRLIIVMKTRHIKGALRIEVLFSLFVFSIRYANQKSLALITRSVNNEKSFYNQKS